MLALVVAAGLIVVLALAFYVLRPGTEPAEPAATGQSATPVLPSPAPAPSAPPDELSAGEWLLTPAADRETYLGRSGDFAAFTTKPTTMTVVAGLADGSCFSFRHENGDYLRHFDYRLRFDADDDSDLFRKDATFCPDGDGPAVQLRSKNFPEHVLHRRGAQLYIDEPKNDEAFERDSTFVVQRPAD